MLSAKQRNVRYLGANLSFWGHQGTVKNKNSRLYAKKACKDLLVQSKMVLYA